MSGGVRTVSGWSQEFPKKKFIIFSSTDYSIRQKSPNNFYKLQIEISFFYKSLTTFNESSLYFHINIHFYTIHEYYDAAYLDLNIFFRYRLNVLTIVLRNLLVCVFWCGRFLVAFGFRFGTGDSSGLLHASARNWDGLFLKIAQPGILDHHFHW